MFVDNNVILLRQPDMTMEGHNNPPGFDDDIAAVLARGTLHVAWDRLNLAVHDTRLQRPHLRVLAVLLDHLNARQGTAWPSREFIAMRCDITVRSVQNILYELRKLNYVSWEKRKLDGDGRRLVQYTVPLAHIDADALKAQIEAYLAPIREKIARDRVQKIARPDVQKTTRPDVHARPNVQKPACPSVQKVTRPDVQQELYQLPVRGKERDSRTSAKAEGVVRKAVRKANDAVRGSRLPEDWVLSAKLGKWALEQFDVSRDQVLAEAQRFKDHWLGKAGKEARKVDWEATWRNWCGSDIRKWKRRKPMTSKIAPDLLDGVQAPQDDAYVQELRSLKAARLAREAEDV